MSASELMKALSFSDRKSFGTRYLKPAPEAELIERTIPDEQAAEVP